MAEDTLVIFDYSGTLSLEAPLFASSENLLRQLELTGLMSLGIKTVKIFWEEIVNPTWHEGSTTSIGYKSLMFRRIKELADQKMLKDDDQSIAASVSRFVDNYLNRSYIDGRWRQILTTLQYTPHVQSIIATDHYAEATATIISYLNQWQIEAIALKEIFSDSRDENIFLVANSADIGSHKEDLAFWTSIKDALGAHCVRQLIIVDDFGAHEQSNDTYSNRRKIEKRRDSIIRLMKNIFTAKVVVVPFFIEMPDEALFSERSANRETYYRQLIEKTASVIEEHLTL
ncbi:MAG: hypothetical protein JXA41_12195 [Deltaproteobacteria bacterium]|nr:hypothetical protein [Deltaproteobacteria bacterium]